MSIDVATLSIQVNTTDIRQAGRDLDGLTGMAGKAEAAMAKLTKVALAAVAALKLTQLAKDSAMIAARFETMGVVMNVAGNNAGYTAAQMAGLEKALRATGISMLESRNTLTQLATANVDLAQATKLARAAQDLAVVGGMNSSDAFNNLVYGLRSGQVEILRTIGLNVNFEDSYKKLAVTLGKSAQGLTEQEKMQARVNIALSESAKYAGIYEASMDTAGKQMSSMKRYAQDLQVQLGEMFQPVLSSSVKTMTDGLKEASVWIKANRLDLLKLGQSADLVAGQVVGLGRAFAGMADVGIESGSALTFIRRTFQGVGFIVAAATESVNGFRVLILSWVEDVMRAYSRLSDAASKVYDKIPGGSGMAGRAREDSKTMGRMADWAGGKKESILIARSPVEQWLDKLEEVEFRAVKAQSHVDKLANSPASTTGKGGGAHGAKNEALEYQIQMYDRLSRAQIEAADAAIKDRMELESWIEELDPATAGTTQFAKAQSDLAWALADGMISQAQYNKLLGLASEKYTEAGRAAAGYQQSLQAQAGQMKNPAEDAIQRLNDMKAGGLINADIYAAELNKIKAQELRWKAEHGDIWAQMGTHVDQYMNRTLDAFVQILNGGKADFRALATSVLQDLQKMILKALLYQAIMSIFGGTSYGSAFGSMFGGGMASGGAVSAGTTYLVGEKGPELLTMGRQPGTITPNSAIGGQQVNNVQIVINQDGTSDASGDTRTAKELASRIRAMVVQELGTQMRTGGMLAGGR